MRTSTTLNCAMALAVLATLGFYSCKKNADDTGIHKTTTPLVTTSGNITIALGTGKSKDSVLLMNVCPAGPRPDTIVSSALPLTVGTYLTLNYSGYTFRKAFKVLTNGTLGSYVIVVNYNNKPIALKFNSDGTFVGILEQREPADLTGPGYHQGGRFDNRDGKCRDTLAVSALPALIKTYFTTNYAGDTIVHAVVNKDTTYIVYSTNKALYATSFSSKGVFVTRIQLNAISAKDVTVAAAGLPASIIPYLTKTYPGYVIHKVFAEKIKKTVIDKYLVFIDDNGTRYAIQFNAVGVFVKATAIK